MDVRSVGVPGEVSSRSSRQMGESLLEHAEDERVTQMLREKAGKIDVSVPYGREVRHADKQPTIKHWLG